MLLCGKKASERNTLITLGVKPNGAKLIINCHPSVSELAKQLSIVIQG